MSEQDELPTTVDELLERMERARAAFYASLAGLSDEQLAAPLTERDWSVADHMAHLAVWMDGIIAAFDGTSRWAAMGADGPTGATGFDELNERLRAPHAGKSPAEARAWLEATHERMAARLRGMTMEQLRRPYSHYQPGEARDDAGAPFLEWVVGDTYSHYDEHRGWIEAALRQRGWA
ncbi:MAG TPA: DinB family protein [Chloroflexaceae bacterium]|nr:DinB family protein [Chloroflexaceae bacterium]